MSASIQRKPTVLKLACIWAIASLNLNVLCQDVPPRLPNIGFLGRGYDAYLGNPHSNLKDPGFRDPVINLEYNQHRTTADGRKLIPYNIHASQTISCTAHVESNEIHGTTSYSDVLSIDASVEGEGFGAKFSASNAFKQVREQSSRFRKTYVTSAAICLAYQANIRAFSRSRVTEDFADAVDHLPITDEVTEGYDAFRQFIDAFGTHYVSSLDMGAKKVVRSEFDQAAWSTLSQSNIDIRVAASSSVSSSISAGTTAANAQQQTFEQQRTSYTASYLGSRPPAVGGWEKWAEDTGNSPYPIKYVLKPLTNLLTQRYFPNTSVSILLAKRNKLHARYSTYCGSLSGCGLPEQDIMPVRFDRIVSSFHHYVKISCRPGYTVLSCGINNSQQRNHDWSRKSFPDSATSCTCYDNHGAECVAWCTDAAVQGFHIAQSHGTWIHVSCPAGKKVIACHIKDDNTSEKYRKFYPTDDGNSCQCWDYYGATCYATCASNIINHEVRSQFGVSVVTARCSPGNSLLGCGRQPRFHGGGEEKFPTVSPDTDICQCWHRYGVTCYAICGQFGGGGE